ncbi:MULTISPECIES: hypothetical protein [unclassified Streptomyces]|nr:MULTISPECIES: hypothetical protein [unclassified Streptomyces]
MATTPVVICSPDEEGSWRVRADDTVLSHAFSVQDVAQFMHEAGLRERD